MKRSSGCLQPHKRTSRLIWFMAGGVALTLAVLFFSLALGASQLSPAELLDALFSPGMGASGTGASGAGVPGAGANASTILHLVRLPRVLACILCGGALALGGLLIQTVLHTPLASPGIIGVNAGSGFAVVLVSFLFPAAFAPRIVAAFLGALGAVLIVYLIASRSNASKLTIVLAGVAVSSLLSAASDALITINPAAVLDKVSFSIGGFSGVGMRQVLPLLPIVVCAIAAAFLLAKQLEILTMGDEVAASLGVRVKASRFFALFTAALLSACAVSIGGLIGFVGLVAPHIARLLCKTSFVKLIGFSFWFGSLLMLLCDLAARLLFRPFEVPTGIVLALVGAPFFLFLLLKKRRGRL